MTTIEIKESVVARLDAQARSYGLSLQEYLERLAESEAVQSGHHPKLTGDELDRLLDSESSVSTSYQGTYPRTDIYLDHA
jgi:hypothetical protein